MKNPEHIDGELTIDHETGTITFKTALDIRLLRITHLPTPIPDNVMIDLVAIKNVTSYTPLSGKSINVSDLDEPEEIFKKPCDTCHKVHADIDEVVMIGTRGLYPEHEYIIETKTKQQKYPRRWRMGYVGKGLDKYHLVFSCRGPDRTHSDQYAGDVTLDIREVLGVRQVPKDVTLRHTGQEVRVGGRAT